MKDVLQKPAASPEPRGQLDPAGFDRHVTFYTFAPPADLAMFVEHFWVIRWDKLDTQYASEQVMHRPYVDVFVSASQSGVQGTFRGKRTYTATAGSGRIVGVRFKPGAFHGFWDGAMADLQDAIIPLRQVFPNVDDEYIEQLLSHDNQTSVRMLAALIRARHPEPDPKIALINNIIDRIEADEGPQTVALVAQQFGKSERRLQQLFSEYVGIGLKWLLQRHKLLAAARLIRDENTPDWVDIAYSLGYSSQQHFITDFKRVLGKTPLQYKKGLSLRH